MYWAIEKANEKARAQVCSRAQQRAEKEVKKIERETARLNKQVEILKRLAVEKNVDLDNESRKELKLIANYLQQKEKGLALRLQSLQEEIANAEMNARRWLSAMSQSGVRQLNRLPDSLVAERFERSKISRKSFTELKKASKESDACAKLFDTLAAMYGCKRNEVLLFEIDEGVMYLWYGYNPVFNAFIKSLRPVTSYRYWPEGAFWSIEITEEFKKILSEHLKMYFAVALDVTTGAVFHNNGNVEMNEVPTRGSVSLHKEDNVYVRFLAVPMQLELTPLVSKVLTLLGYVYGSEEALVAQIGLHIYDGEKFVRVQEVTNSETLSVYATRLLFELALDFGDCEYVLITARGVSKKAIVTSAGTIEHKEVAAYMETCRVVGKRVFVGDSSSKVANKI